MEEIILASASSRRKQIFMQMHLPFRVVIPVCNEQEIQKKDVENRVMNLAYMKGMSVCSLLKNPGQAWVSGFDTMIEVDGKVIGKAGTEKEAVEMLCMLSGRVHRVYTGVALVSDSGKWDIRVAMSEVKLTHMLKKEIDFYISTGEWKGVAGSYRIQECGAFFIEWIKGSYSNIVGLPISLFYGMLKDNNYSFSLRQGN
ncbi:MAG: septum formation protein Maf [Spirochaetales bacterium]|nr:septum formation protein Maf [Spirochaetales bacterium]